MSSSAPENPVKRIQTTGVYCAAKDCKNNSGNFQFGFFRFPKDEERAKTWAVMCHREDLGKNLYNFRLCAQHFSNEMFKDQKRRGLTSTAYPSIFSFEAKATSSKDTEEVSLTASVSEPAAKKIKFAVEYRM